MVSSPPAPTISSSSPASRCQAELRSSPVAIAFLVHSQETLGANLPPDVDNKPLARQRRRRTSREDEDILKAQYLRNPKPDKATRLELVSKVALSLKEVQIWFQNKRQNDRRRARPADSSSSMLSSSSLMSDPPIEEGAAHPDQHVAHEDASEHGIEHGIEQEADPAKGTALPAQDTMDIEQHQQNQDEHDLEGSEQCTQEQESIEQRAEAIPEQSAQQTEAAEDAHDSQETAEINAVVADDSEDSMAASAAMPSTSPATVEPTLPELTASQQTVSSQAPTQPRTSWISNRRSASFVRDYDSAENAIFPNLAHSESATSSRSLKRAHSFVRLSMTTDGKARVVTSDDQSPSPPHARPTPDDFPRGGLRRSFSAAGFNERLAREALSLGERSPKVPRLSNASSSIGRSRDSRAWEFWCDPDSRHSMSLTNRAEQEGSGSAADAIGLMRANSKKALAHNSSRANTPLSRTHSSVLSENGIKKSRSFGRSATTHGRLQSKGKSDSESDDLPQTESDKENWEPDLPKLGEVLRRANTASQGARARQVLGENTDIMSQSQSLGAFMDRERKSKGGRKRGRENKDPEDDEELRAFMNGDGVSGRTSLSSAEEAGCVEGLLKLSQGNWR